ncbi:signal peptidase I [Lichenicoccus sp.]|uniref:signal peptidase I n=1 Tax=Lichenicoccus sp. TaxID=2781899 RepID=UPI003D1410B0
MSAGKSTNGEKAANAAHGRKQTRSGAWELLRTLVYAGLIAVFVRTFLFESFNIPSGSMIPTLLVGDYLFVSKYAYGYSRFSMPLAPDLFEGRILYHRPHRGDVAVFRFTQDTSIDYIKRIVGLPGDHVRMQGGQLYINGTEVPRTPLGDYIADDENGDHRAGRLYRESLPGSGGHKPVRHLILKQTSQGQYNNTPDYMVPAGYFFAMGDNRDDSADSRFMGTEPDDLGFVPIQNLVGRADFIFFSIDERDPIWAFWDWPAEIRWGRILHWVH